MLAKYALELPLAIRSILIVLFTVLLTLGQANAAVNIENLQVEYRPTPLGIDVEQPRFSWQMAATQGERGYSQAAYRLEVRGPDGNVVWDTGRTEGAASLGIEYAGSQLSAATRYSWMVTVWDQAGVSYTARSWFETGLMDPDPNASAWDGAQWIGGGNEDLVLYAPYLAVFDTEYIVAIEEGSTRASFVYGANDPRMMDRYKNIFQVENARDESYIKVELDVSGVDGTREGTAKLNVYRAGYTDTDTPDTPLRSIEISTKFINNINKNAEHIIGFTSAFGRISLSLDGSEEYAVNSGGGSGGGGRGGFGGGGGPTSVNLNPVGSGGDYIAYGLLADIGFSVDPGQSATFREVTIRNDRWPNNILFIEAPAAEDYSGIFADAAATNPGFSIANGRFILNGGSDGVFVARDPSHNSMPMLRTTFDTSGRQVESARLYVTARGIYEVYLNGERVGDDHYNPGLTQYNITHLYQTYDVTSMIRSGQNAMGAMLGEGWWSGLLSFGSIWNHFGDRQSLRAKLAITYDDGSTDVVTTNDGTWKFYNDGPLVYSSLDFGEIYDTSREPAVDGWTTAGYDDSAWKAAVEVPLQGTAYMGMESSGRGGGPPTSFDYDRLSLIGQIGNNAGVFRVLSAQSVNEVRPGVYVYNLGQNIVGVPRIEIANGQAGGKLTLRYAEMLYPDLEESGDNVGMVMTENYRAALSTDVYTMKAGAQTFQPRFTSHGFQYIEVTGIDAPLPLEAVQGVAMSSIRELTAGYQSSNEKVNQLWSNLVWSNVDNFLTIPTDCPQRNERMGWSGDINVFSRTSTYVSNADQFLTRHMYAMRDVQRADGRFTDVAPVGGGFGGILWGSAGIVVPWETYLQYGDVGLLEQHYPAMAAYVDYLQTTIDRTSGLSSDAQLGDWLGPQNNQLGTALLATAYHAYDLGIVAKVAEVLGRTEDAEKYGSLYEVRKGYFNSTFVNARRKTVTIAGGRGFGGGGRGGQSAPAQLTLADTQTSYAVGLGMDLFSEANIPYMVQNLADTVRRENTDDNGVVRPPYSLMTGFIGTSWISKALSDNGLVELAYRQLQNDQYPSWLYAIDQGATTIWERLNGYTVENGCGGNNSMNSFNHCSFGAVGQWLLAYSAGIQRDEPGFQKFILQPEPDPTGEMTSAEGYYDSMYGTIESAWDVDDGTLTYRATVPANTTATLYLPATSEQSVSEGGQSAADAEGVTFLRYEDGKAVYTLASGTYEFSSSL